MRLDQLVLIRVTFINDNGQFADRSGTGYFIANNLVLTSNHVLPLRKITSIAVRLHESNHWTEAESTPLWQNAILDASLIKVKTNYSFSVEWQRDPIRENQEWTSVGYPEASVESLEGKDIYVSKGLKGTVYFGGGGGQVEIPRLDLAVEAPPKDPERWKGISGAPIFVGNSLIGIIKNIPDNFTDRLEGVSSHELLKDPGFRSAVEPDSLALPEIENWALILHSEGSIQENLLDPTSAAISECCGPECLQIVTSITKSLQTPGSLLNFVKLLCRAPLVIVDATNFQPGVMMMIGIRAVVRRGVTIMVTTEPLKQSDLASLPFNIQEIKLISLDERSDLLRTILTSKERLKKAITEGRDHLKTNPKYLDLPPYDAVRNPVISDIPSIEKKILVLCPFNKEYDDRNFPFLREKLANWVQPTENIIRMLDITSPQLVGQSLYEHIRWTKLCIIDWTNWLPNVFYELGVRLAASYRMPIVLLDASEVQQLQNEPQPQLQKQQLLNLFGPGTYSALDRAFPSQAVKQQLDYLNGKSNIFKRQFDIDRIFNDNIYSIAQQYFDWTQEGIADLPDQSIQSQIEREYGADRQTLGKYNVLYSANDKFKKAIQDHIREYWLAAWYYKLNRYPFAEYETDESKRRELITLGETVMDSLDREDFKNIRRQILDIIDKLENI